MKKLIAILLILSLVLVGCTAPDSDNTTPSGPDLHQSAPSEDSSSQTDPTTTLDDVVTTLGPTDPPVTTPSAPDSNKNETNGTEGDGPAGSTEGTTPTESQPTSPQPTEKPTTPTDPPEDTKPTTPTVPTEDTKPTDPPETKPTEPPVTEPEETTPPATEPEDTEPQIDKDSYEFKRQVAYYAAQYINQYRAAAGVSPCTVLPGMTLVAEYRADQLTYNYSHDTADKREALAYYQYGKWVDATLAGLDASKSYYDAEASEAICAGFEGKTAEEMGKYIADLCRNSSSHWSYVGSGNFSYIGIGVEYRAGTAYGWYGCIMVGRTNYG